MDSTGSLESGNGEKSIQKRLKFSYDQDDKVSHVVDRFSQLPDPIISSILSLVPTKLAVSTSLLSKDLRFCWKYCTSLDFDDQLLFMSSDRAAADNMSFVEFVEKVLSNNTMKFINKFRLHCRRSPDLLSQWVSTAVDRNVQVLDLATGSNACLPDSLVTSGTLEVVKIGGPIKVIPPQAVFLPKVTVLELNNVIYKSDESFSNLISACPLLHYLTIKRKGRRDFSDNLVDCAISSPSLKHLHVYFERMRWSQSKTKLEIEAPALENLILHDDMSRYICIKGPTRVKEVDLDVLCEVDDFDEYNSDEEEGDLRDKDEVVADLVETFCGVEIMKLGCRTSDALLVHPPLATFRSLTKLVVEDCEYTTVIGLLDCCINLQVLHTCGVNRFYPTKTFKVPGCVVSGLKHVSVLIRPASNIFDAEMEMLKFLLQKGAVLESVNLRFNRFISSMTRCDIINEVSKFPRASRTCEISWSEEEP